MPRSALLLSLFGFGLGLLAMLSTGGIPVAMGQPKPLVVPPAPQAPKLTTPVTLGMKPGASVDLVLSGANLNDPLAVMLSCPGKAGIVPEAKGAKPNPGALKVKIDLPADAPIGLHTIRVATQQGVSNFRPFLIDDLPAVDEIATNRTKDTAQEVPVPSAINARADAEASDFFKMKVAAGQKLTFEVLAHRIGSPLDPIIVLHDAKTKRELVDLYADDTPGLQSDCRLTHTFKQAGEILVEVRDTTYRGGGDFFYRLRIADVPGALCAYPLAVQRGVDAKIGFAGPGMDDVPPVAVKGSTDPFISAINVAPKRAGGPSGWPLPVRLSDEPQIVEQEPNNTPDKATKLAVPGGVSARFLEKGDLDQFAIAGKKGQKLAVTAWTFEVNSPAEVLIRLLDAKGAEVGRSNPAAAGPTQVEFTPAADGIYTVACEHLNYLFGPNEVYHLSVHPVAPDFEVSLVLDRCEAPVGGGTSVAVANIVRLHGFGGPIELSIAANAALSGSITVPNGQAQSFVPLFVKAGTRPGAYPFHVKASAKIDGKEIVRYARLTDFVKANLGGMSNPPPELLTGCIAAVVEKPAFTVKFTPEPAAFEKGKAGKLLVEATREKGIDGDITLAPLFVPPNITPAVKPIPKGMTKAEVGLTLAPAVALGQSPIVIRATTKVGGKDYTVTPPPTIIDVIVPKKVEPKKEEPKKKDKK
ncbi:MAG TPA: hypothetical protein VGL71_09810 [Urbifossiella sp.]